MDTEFSTPCAAEMAMLQQVVRRVAAHGRLSPHDAEDFAQEVHLRLLERGYDVFRRFDGRSSLQTYLTVVVTRMLLDWRDRLYGRWRPSALATRLGEDAVRLEQLISRDSFSVEEAVATVTAERPARDRAELQRLADRLPPRQRRRLESIDALGEIAVAAFEDPVEAEERRREESNRLLALARALDRLSASDRRLIAARYLDGRTAHSIALECQVDTKVVYRRCARLFSGLRRVLSLACAGVAGASPALRRLERSTS